MTTPDYQAHNFVDGPAGGTPITAAILNDDEAAIVAMHAALQATRPTGVVDIQAQSGVVGDGVADDATAINNAITAAPAGSLFWFAATKKYLVGSTIVLKPGCVYASTGGSSGAKIVGSSTLTGAILAAQGWQNNTTTACDSPVQVRGLQITGPGQTTGTAAGIVLMNYWSRIENCFVGSTGGDGIRFTDTTRGGSPLTVSSASCSENKVIDCKVSQTGGHGIYIQNTATFATNQDGHIVDSYIDTSGTAANGRSNIYCDRGAGWFISRNHLYGSYGDAMHVVNGFATHIVDNYIEEFWGQQNSASTDYAGIFLSQGPYSASVISGNYVGAVQGNNLTAANAWANYHIEANSAATATTPANVVFTDNSAISTTTQTGTNNKSLSVVLTGPNNAIGQLVVGASGNSITPGGWATTAPGWYSGYTLSSTGVVKNSVDYVSLYDGAIGQTRFLPNVSAAPTANPTGGGLLYVDAGALKFRGSNGTVTTIAIA